MIINLVGKLALAIEKDIRWTPGSSINVQTAFKKQLYRYHIDIEEEKTKADNNKLPFLFKNVSSCSLSTDSTTGFFFQEKTRGVFLENAYLFEDCRVLENCMCSKTRYRASWKMSICENRVSWKIRMC